MNKKILFLAVLAAILSQTPHASAQAVFGNTLEIKPSSSGSAVLTPGSGSIGLSNEIYADKSLAIGQSNLITSTRTLFVGYSNGNYSSLSGGNSLVVGQTNINGVSSATLQSSAVVGSLTTGVPAGSSSLFGLTSSFVVGEANGVNVTAGFVAGRNNNVNGQHYVMGEGLVADTTNPRMVVLGQFNISPTAGQLLVVGNGTSTGGTTPTISRNNALEVYADGTVKVIKRQADLGMGRFGKPGDQ